jgi:hypothetical protein
MELSNRQVAEGELSVYFSREGETSEGRTVPEAWSFLMSMNVYAWNHVRSILDPSGSRSMHISGNLAFPLYVLKIIYSQQVQRNRVPPLFTREPYM